MNEEVIISIKGLRVTEDTDEDVEVITPGKYYLKRKIIICFMMKLMKKVVRQLKI